MYYYLHVIGQVDHSARVSGRFIKGNAMQLVVGLIVFFCFLAFVWGVWLLLSAVTSSFQRMFQLEPGYPTLTAAEMVVETQPKHSTEACANEELDADGRKLRQLQSKLKALQDLQRIFKEGGLSQPEYEHLKAQLIQDIGIAKAA
ncbi:hypothetical protein [Lampropedia aestuarii]|uniref:hypothetical protein n=1 Tax=Lampropedia aestuarii TaxID=2562762 RepID=UPI0024695BF3|nr:hypothetical protein [Lampropedia aestuarii]MDH5859189.1 hypothetical protein [Lampropedia aestuarii]